MTETTTPTGPVARDPLNPNVVIPVYLGGEGPVPTPPAGDRGDSVAPSLPQGTAAAALAAAAATDPAATTAADGSGKGDQGSDGNAPLDGTVPATVTTTDPVTPPVDKPAGQRNEKGQFIPRSRFNEVNEERKRLAEENAALKAAQGATQQVDDNAYDFDAKEKEYANLVIDGKIDDAIKLRQEIRAAERAVYQQDARKTTVETTKQMSVKERVDTVVARYEQNLPQFDPESEHYNEDLLNDVADIYRGALEGGRYADPAEAFEASIKKALKLHDIAEPTDAPATTTTTTPTQVPGRTAAKRVEAIVNQPPTLAKTGTTGAPETHATIDVKALSDRELAALPEATRRRLRGDMV